MHNLMFPRYELREGWDGPPHDASLTPPTSPASDDEYSRAVVHVTEFGRASASMLQRKLHIGYGPAIDLIRRMQREGLIDQRFLPAAARQAASPETKETAVGEGELPRPVERLHDVELEPWDINFYSVLETNAFIAHLEKERDDAIAQRDEARAAHGKTLLALHKAAFETIPELEAKLAASAGFTEEELERVNNGGRILSNAMAYLNEQEPRNVEAVAILNHAWAIGFKEYSRLRSIQNYRLRTQESGQAGKAGEK